MRRRNEVRKALTINLLLFVSLIVWVPSASAGIEQMEAQNLTVWFDSDEEITWLEWYNVETESSHTLDNLTSAIYKVYRSPEPINSTNYQNLTPILSVKACNEERSWPWFEECSGDKSLGHLIVGFPIDPGVNGTFHYGILTELNSVVTSERFTANESHTFQPITEITRANQAPIMVQAEYDGESDTTRISWVNTNELSTDYPEEGPDALEIHVWRHEEEANRVNWSVMSKELIATLPAKVEDNRTFFYDYSLPNGTEGWSNYSVTYLLYGWEDFRFDTSCTTMNPVWEDNVAPEPINSIVAEFHPPENSTQITWTAGIEEGLTYSIWRSANPMVNTTDAGLELVATCDDDCSAGEGSLSYQYIVPPLRYGEFYYAVTTTDAIGNSNTTIPSLSQAGPVMENTLNNTLWPTIPSNINATYLNGGVTRVSWRDQEFAEGEYYHVWRSLSGPIDTTSFLLQGEAFNPNGTIKLVATVSDSVEYADIPVPDGVDRTAYYAVTSVVRYSPEAEPYEEFTFQLGKNSIAYLMGVHEDTLEPEPWPLAEVISLGTQGLMVVKWFNDGLEAGESYSLYRHLGDPFNGTNSSTVTEDDGWELILDDIPDWGTTILQNIELEGDVERDVWYGLVVTDSYENTNPLILKGDNALSVREDTLAPTAQVWVENDKGEVVSILRVGSYRMFIQPNEALYEAPMLNITGPDGEITEGNQFGQLHPSGYYYLDFNVPEMFPGGVSPRSGNVTINVDMKDTIENPADLHVTNWTIDATRPEVEIFSPQFDNGLSKYLYGGYIRVRGGVRDDVSVEDLQLRFIRNLDPRLGYEPITESWRSVNEVTVTDSVDPYLAFDYSILSDNFEVGKHRLEIRAVDTAGNEIIFISNFWVDECQENETGMTVCRLDDNQLNPPEEPGEPPIDFKSPQFLLADVMIGINVVMLFVLIIVLSTVMSGPKKKKSRDDDEEGEEWMDEYMDGGETAEQDIRGAVDSNTSTGSEDKKEDAKLVEDDDDPFASTSGGGTPKRKKKARPKPRLKDDLDEDEEYDDWDDEEDDWDDEEDEKPAPKKKSRKVRKVKRR